MLDISVVIPHYNNDEQIMRAYSSVMAQSVLPKEIIIVDDASNDLSFLKRLESTHKSKVNLKVIYLENNSGPSKARNHGVSLSIGSYIAFLDADDVWHPQKLELIFKILSQNIDINFIFHQYLFYPPIECIEFESDKLILKKFDKKLLMFKNYIATPTVVLRRKKFIPFPEHLSYCEDYCCWLLNSKRPLNPIPIF